jgi:hypothetical protein
MIKYLILIPLAFILVSCENSQIVESDAPYQQYIVVNAEINPEALFPGVTFTKTLPIGVTYDIKTAELKDVTAYLRVNGVQIVPLHYSGDGLYKPMYDFLIHAGATCELFAERQGTVIYSSTYIPFPPEINSVSYNAGGNYLQAFIKPKPGEVYGAIWLIGTSNIAATTFPEITSPDANTYNVSVNTTAMPDQYAGVNYNGMRNIQVVSYDKQYKDYFNSIKVNVPLGNAFLQNGGTAAWNVFGNNVIGMFIGVGKSSIRNVN